MKWIISRYNHDVAYLKDYTDDYVMYDRSEIPISDSRTIVVPNIGSDIYDKFSFIIDNYDNLPDVAVYTKANLPKYITKEEFEKIKDNKTFTPILTQNHKETTINTDEIKEVLDKKEFFENKELIYEINKVGKFTGIQPFSFYKDKMYYEFNNSFFMNTWPIKNINVVKELQILLGIWDKDYVAFAPGSNYILPRENILKHPKVFYEKLRSYLDWHPYPAEAAIMERGLYHLWK